MFSTRYGRRSPSCVLSLFLLPFLADPFLPSQSAVYYFQPQLDNPIPHSAPQTQAFIESVSKWNVGARHIEDELRRQAVRFLLFFFLSSIPKLTVLYLRFAVINDRPLSVSGRDEYDESGSADDCTEKLGASELFSLLLSSFTSLTTLFSAATRQEG
jgi:hypothetical protein